MVVIFMLDMQYHHLTKLKAFTNKNSAVAEMGDRWATIYMG